MSETNDTTIGNSRIRFVALLVILGALIVGGWLIFGEIKEQRKQQEESFLKKLPNICKSVEATPLTTSIKGKSPFWAKHISIKNKQLNNDFGGGYDTILAKDINGYANSPLDAETLVCIIESSDLKERCSYQNGRTLQMSLKTTVTLIDTKKMQPIQSMTWISDPGPCPKTDFYRKDMFGFTDEERTGESPISYDKILEWVRQNWML